MKPKTRRVLVGGVILGTIVSFLFSQPLVLKGFLEVTNSFFSVFPKSVSKILRGQTYLALALAWFILVLGFIIWIIRGEFFRAEPEPRRKEFDVVEGNSDPKTERENDE